MSYFGFFWSNIGFFWLFPGFSLIWGQLSSLQTAKSDKYDFKLQICCSILIPQKCQRKTHFNTRQPPRQPHHANVAVSTFYSFFDQDICFFIIISLLYILDDKQVWAEKCNAWRQSIKKNQSMEMPVPVQCLKLLLCALNRPRKQTWQVS